MCLLSRSDREIMRDRSLLELSSSFRWSELLSVARCRRWRCDELDDRSEGRVRAMYGGVPSLPVDGVRGRGGSTTGKGNSALLQNMLVTSPFFYTTTHPSY